MYRVSIKYRGEKEMVWGVFFDKQEAEAVARRLRIAGRDASVKPRVRVRVRKPVYG